jgi:PTS system fructose-specific IIA component
VIINDVLSEKLIDLDMHVKDKNDVIDKMAEMFYKNGIVKSKEDYLKDVFKREKLGTTGVGMGIAIPHGKSKSVLKTAVAIAKLHKPIDWDSSDSTPTKMVFMLAVPEGKNSIHIKLLSQLASLLMDDNFREKLFNVKEKSDILKCINLNIK